jgi:arabinogalactan endo-1,4-beta-galactosidase
MKRLLVFCLALCLCLPALALGEDAELYVRNIGSVPDDFIFGMDLSSVISLENGGTRFYDFDGNETDIFSLLKQNGITHIRARLWNDPYDSEGRPYGGGVCDLDTLIQIGLRSTKAGLKLIVDFHYSDFWADPGKQMPPKAWADMSAEEKAQAVYEFTLSSLTALKENGVDVGMVQAGNETNGRMCGETGWAGIVSLMDAGLNAVREVYPDALTALHFTNPENTEQLKYFAKQLEVYSLDYDVFATSWYPFWHGSLDNLSAVLSDISDAYGKKVLVMETSYPYTSLDSDFSGNTVSDNPLEGYPFTPQGQANMIADLADTLINRTHSAIGLVYWEGAWITAGGASYDESLALWEKYGSGWATRFAGEYDPNDAGKYYGGSAVDNQTFFDPQGRPLESLKVFRLMREGNEIPAVPDALEDVTVTCDLNAPLELPETVNAVMTDDSRQEVPVTWHITEDDERKMHEGGVAQYTVPRDAGGMEATCYISMIEYNYLTDYSFEEDSRAWIITDLKKADELYIEDKKTDSLTGAKHMHFWSAAQNSVEFTLEQIVSDLPEGRFRFSASIMGGDCGETEIFAYVKVDGEIVAKSDPMPITGYNNWHMGTTPVFEHPAGSEVTVGVYVKCQGTGNGAWGKIDDCLLNSVQ